MMPEAGVLDPADETCREDERVVDENFLDQIRKQTKEFSNKRLSRQSGVARSAIMNFKNGRNTIKPRTLRKLTKAIHSLQNKSIEN
jgi:transposase-like protein